MVGYWLLKSEAEEWSWQHQHDNGGLSHWDGVRNAQAQNFLRAMLPSDLCFFYHSGKSKHIVGIAQVCKPFYPDPSDASGKCGMVDIQAVSQFPTPVSLARLKQEACLKDFVLFRQPRLSVVPVSDVQWARICELGNEQPSESLGEDSNIQQVSGDCPPRRKRSKKQGDLLPGGSSLNDVIGEQKEDKDTSVQNSLIKDIRADGNSNERIRRIRRK